MNCIGNQEKGFFDGCWEEEDGCWEYWWDSWLNYQSKNFWNNSNKKNNKKNYQSRQKNNKQVLNCQLKNNKKNSFYYSQGKIVFGQEVDQGLVRRNGQVYLIVKEIGWEDQLIVWWLVLLILSYIC